MGSILTQVQLDRPLFPRFAREQERGSNSSLGSPCWKRCPGDSQPRWILRFILGGRASKTTYRRRWQRLSAAQGRGRRLQETAVYLVSRRHVTESCSPLDTQTHQGFEPQNSTLVWQWTAAAFQGYYCITPCLRNWLMRGLSKARKRAREKSKPYGPDTGATRKKLTKLKALQEITKWLWKTHKECGGDSLMHFEIPVLFGLHLGQLVIF